MVRFLSFDLLVVGAGPGGCAAAAQAARHGMTVGMVERDRFPRDLPGEALHPDVGEIFKDLGVQDAVAEAGFVKYPGWMLERQGQSTFMPFGEPPTLRFGFQAWRADLDSILLSHARRCGVAVFEGACAERVLISDGRITGVRTSEHSLAATHVLDASGPRRWLSKKLGKSPAILSPRLVARYGYSKKDFGLGNIPIFREHDNGWTWLAKVSDDCSQCVQLSLTADADVPSLPRDYGFPPRLRGADVTWRLLGECAGPGYFICGDAAATLDPAGSRGVARALEGGMKIAALLAAVHNGGISERDASRAYREWLTNKLYREAQNLADRHALLRHAPPWVRTFGEQFEGERYVEIGKISE